MKLRKIAVMMLVALVTIESQAANIMLENCETLSFNKARGGACQVLRGHVRFRQDRTVMYCDSAYFYSSQNSFDAFGHVRVVQDSTELTANKMFYDGNLKLMRVRENITMRSGHFVLTTQKLDYYRQRGFAYYDEGAKITDPQFHLTSRIGYYYPQTRQAIFKHDVDLESKDFKIHTDTLSYNPRTGIATVLGPSKIFREGYVVTTKYAWMNNKKGDFRLYRRSLIESTDGMQHLIADTIYYNRTKGIARAYNNIDAYDLRQHIGGRGNYGYFRQLPVHSGFLTRNGYIMEYSSKDTMYIHADTLSFNSDKSDQHRELKGRHNVRFFRNDFQGKCENMVYETKDSVVNMMGYPVLWSQQNQLTGDTVRLYMRNKKPDWLHITGSALIVQRDDSLDYNQLAGRELKGYFINNQMRKVDIIGNAVSVFFPKDKAGDLIGVNRTEGSQMTIYINDKRKLEKILMQPGTDGVMYPPFEAPKEVLFLKKFSWQYNIRPKYPMDIFTRYN
jgi:lipopolysaccharide export system protein LptA